MNQFNDFLILLDSNLSGSWWFPALLIGTGIFFTIYLRFPQFRYFKSAIKIVSCKNRNTEEGTPQDCARAMTAGYKQFYETVVAPQQQ